MSDRSPKLNIRDINRLREISQILIKHGFSTFVRNTGILSYLPKEHKEKVSIPKSLTDEDSNRFSAETLSKRIRVVLEELGPAYIKLGQLLGTREDLLEKPYIDQLKKLHSSVHPVPFGEIEKVVRSSLSPEQFADIEKIESKPLAAGSIAQVHKVLLKDGRQIVFKIQKPGIESRIAADLSLFSHLAMILERYVEFFKKMRLRKISQEFSSTILSELNFIREAGNTEQMFENFSENPNIMPPEVIWDYTTAKVLALSFVEGVPIGDLKAMERNGIDKEQAFHTSLEMFLSMLFTHGFMHGDLHPGNLLVSISKHANSAETENLENKEDLGNQKPGTIVLSPLDFGAAATLSSGFIKKISLFLYSFFHKDFENLCYYYLDISDHEPDLDSKQFIHEITALLRPYMGTKQVKHFSMGNLLWEFVKTATRNGAPMPQEMALVIRNIVTLEGLGKSLAPHYDIVEECKKFMNQRMDSNSFKSPFEGLFGMPSFAALIKNTPAEWRFLAKQISQGKYEFKVRSSDLQSLAQALDRSSSRLSVSVIMASITIGFSILAVGGTKGLGLDNGFINGAFYTVITILSFYVLRSIRKGNKK